MFRGSAVSFLVFRKSAGDALGFIVVIPVPKNALRAFSNESSAVGFAGFISVFDGIGLLLTYLFCLTRCNAFAEQ
jgi:hypothetical protein